MSAIVWMHGGSLSVTDPALSANVGAPAIFVFDEPFLKNNRISFARLQFMYESAVEALEGRAHRVCVGEQAAEIILFAQELNCTEIHTTALPSPELNRTINALEAAGFTVHLHKAERLTSYKGKVKRFSAFWRAVEREVWSEK